MQKPKNFSDIELFEPGIKVIETKIEYLLMKIQEKLIAIFTKFQNTWKKPRAAQIIKYTVLYKVNKPPIKTKMRPLNPAA